MKKLSVFLLIVLVSPCLAADGGGGDAASVSAIGSGVQKKPGKSGDGVYYQKVSFAPSSADIMETDDESDAPRLYDYKACCSECWYPELLCGGCGLLVEFFKKLPCSLGAAR